MRGDSMTIGKDYSYAPYNFIPFEEDNFVARYKSEEELPKHNVISDELYTGCIQYQFECKTPIFVGSTENGSFCRNADGKFIVPGSTMRGFIRSHTEILGFSYPEFITDAHYMNRQFASKGSRHKEYMKILKEQDSPDYGMSGIVGRIVQAGSVYYDKAQQSYFIQPLKPIGKSTFIQMNEGWFSQCYDKYNLPSMAESCFMYSEYKEPDKPSSKKPYEGNDRTRNRGYRPFRGREIYSYDADRNEVVPVNESLPKVRVMNNAYIREKQQLFLISA